DWWAWFGGIAAVFEEGTLTQTVNIPANASLNFYLTAFSQRSDGQDFLKIYIDSTQVFSVTDLDIGPYTTDYVLVSVNLATFTGSHVLKFDSQTVGTNNLYTNFWVDDVSIDGGNPPPTCYPNCDGSTATPCLPVQDFGCF